VVLFLLLAGPRLFRKPWREIHVPYGKTELVVLNDGTRVTLDSGSLFRYPKKFKTGEKKSWLNGEGFFEVATDSDKPFLVESEGAVVRVLGTSFNLKTWESMERAELTVSEGKVLFHPAGANESEGVVVVGGERSVLHYGRRPSFPEETDISARPGWINREVYFQDVSLGEILFYLERWFDVRFSIPHEDVKEERLTVHVSARPLADIIELIAVLTELEYEQQGRNITLVKK
jgi:ferric-dicitrate binding protein FerR (iron transport regulator)